MILHLVNDEKIINRIMNLFDEALGEENRYICFLHTKVPLFVHPREHLFFYNGTKEPDIDYNKIDKVVIHFLDYRKVCFCNKYIPSNVLIYWVLWGADLYNGLLARRGYSLYYNRRFYPLRANLFWLARKAGYGRRKEKCILKFISTRVHYFLADCRDEYLLLRKYLPEYTGNIQHREFFYYPVDDVLGAELVNKWASGNNILLGNSASFTNNHEYALKQLAKCTLKDKIVIAPISYGGTSQSRNSIKEYGWKLFGNQFHPLETFLPLNEYNRLMCSAEVCIYGSWRQEAMGNIVMALYLGAKVFLSKYSPLLSWYKEMGVAIYELESIDDEQLNTPLAEENKMRNREILQKRYSRDRMFMLIHDSFE